MKKIFLLCFMLLCSGFVFAQDPIGLPTTDGGLDPGSYFPPLPSNPSVLLTAPSSVTSGSQFTITAHNEINSGYISIITFDPTRTTTSNPAGLQNFVSYNINQYSSSYNTGTQQPTTFIGTATLASGFPNPINATLFFNAVIYDAVYGNPPVSVVLSVTVTINPVATSGGGSGGSTGGGTTTTSLTAPLYRLYSSTGQHFYTTNSYERSSLLNPFNPYVDGDLVDYLIQFGNWVWDIFTGNPTTWSDEGVVGYVYKTAQPGTVPLQRYYNPSTLDHMYSVDANEESTLPGLGYQLEGTIGYVYNTQATGTIPVYRYYPNDSRGHFFTQNFNELQYGSDGYNYEGVAYYLFPH